MSKSIAVLTMAMALVIPARAVAQQALPCCGQEDFRPCGGPFHVPFLTKAETVQALHTALDPFARVEAGAVTNIHTHRISRTAFSGRAEIDGPHQLISLRWQIWGEANSTNCDRVVETTVVALKNRRLAFPPPDTYR
jgi:hypothetical protein